MTCCVVERQPSTIKTKASRIIIENKPRYGFSPSRSIRLPRMPGVTEGMRWVALQNSTPITSRVIDRLPSFCTVEYTARVMRTDNKLMEMLVGYAAAHQHPFNIFVHMIGIPVILFGVLIAASWVTIEIETFQFTLGHVVVVGLFVFYLTLDVVFALVFLAVGITLATLAGWIADLPFATSASIAATCFFGGYLAQFIGHAVEKSMPVLVRHPIQANLAAPFFTVVELFKLLGLRSELFDQVQAQIASRRDLTRSRN